MHILPFLCVSCLPLALEVGPERLEAHYGGDYISRKKKKRKEVQKGTGCHF
jgi:hypothetical protein